MIKNVGLMLKQRAVVSTHMEAYVEPSTNVRATYADMNHLTQAWRVTPSHSVAGERVLSCPTYLCCRSTNDARFRALPTMCPTISVTPTANSTSIRHSHETKFRPLAATQAGMAD